MKPPLSEWKPRSDTVAFFPNDLDDSKGTMRVTIPAEYAAVIVGMLGRMPGVKKLKDGTNFQMSNFYASLDDLLLPLFTRHSDPYIAFGQDSVKEGATRPAYMKTPYGEKVELALQGWKVERDHVTFTRNSYYDNVGTVTMIGPCEYMAVIRGALGGSSADKYLKDGTTKLVMSKFFSALSNTLESHGHGYSSPYVQFGREIMLDPAARPAYMKPKP